MNEATVAHVRRSGWCGTCGGTGDPKFSHRDEGPPADIAVGMKHIELSPEPDPPTLDDRIRGAVYEACMYHRVTQIRVGHQVAYIVGEHIWPALKQTEGGHR